MISPPSTRHLIQRKPSGLTITIWQVEQVLPLSETTPRSADGDDGEVTTGSEKEPGGRSSVFSFWLCSLSETRRVIHRHGSLCFILGDRRVARIFKSYVPGKVAHTKEIKMSLSKRFFLLGSILLMAALVFTFSPTTPSAHAASVSASTHAPTMTPSAVSPDFTCPSRTICFFQNDDFTGSSFSCATDVCRGAWFSVTFNGVHPGSVNDNSDSIFFAADVQLGLEKCFQPGRHVLDHMYGFFFVEFGVTNCPPPSQFPPLP